MTTADDWRRLRPRPAVPWTLAGSWIVIWPVSGPQVIPRLASVLWPHLDGESRLGDLFDDLVIAVDGQEGPYLSQLARILKDFLVAGILTTDGGEIGTNWPPLEVVDTQPLDGGHDVSRVYSTSMTVSVAESVADADTSLLELLPPESCAGTRLGLNEAGTFTTLETLSGPVRIRYAESTRRGSDEHSGGDDRRGPVRAFVRGSGTRLAGKTLDRVYDESGRLTAATRIPDLASSIATSIAIEAASSDPMTYVRADLFRYHDLEGLIAFPPGIGERRPGLLQSWERGGLVRIQTSGLRVADGRLVPGDADPDEPLTLAFAGRQGDAHAHASAVLAFLVGARSREAENRQRLLSALAASRPMMVTEFRRGVPLELIEAIRERRSNVR